MNVHVDAALGLALHALANTVDEARSMVARGAAAAVADLGAFSW